MTDRKVSTSVVQEDSIIYKCNLLLKRTGYKSCLEIHHEIKFFSYDLPFLLVFSIKFKKRR